MTNRTSWQLEERFYPVLTLLVRRAKEYTLAVQSVVNSNGSKTAAAAPWFWSLYRNDTLVSHGNSANQHKAMKDAEECHEALVSQLDRKHPGRPPKQP